MSHSNSRVTKSEKRLFWFSGLAVAALVGFAYFSQQRNLRATVQIPTPKMPNPNAFDFYVRATKAMVRANPAVDAIHDTSAVYLPPGARSPVSSIPTDPRALKSRYPIAAKEAWLARNKKAFGLLRQGFKHRYLHPPVRSLNAPTGFYGRFRDIARMIAVESHARAERGRWSAAAASGLDSLRLGLDVPRGGPLIAGLVSNSMQAIARRDLWEIVPRLNAVESRAATARMEAILARQVPYATVLQEEKWTGQATLLETLEEMEKIGRWQWRVMAAAPASSFKSASSPSNFWRALTISKPAVLDSYTRYMDALVADARLPYAAPRAPPLPDSFLIDFLAPDSRARWSQARAESGNVLLLVTLALQTYHRERGTYPAKLSELTPRYLKQIPADPFGAGEALRYRLKGKSYLLWSIGPDGVDDGGRPIINLNKKGRSRTILLDETSKGDLEAHVNRG